MIYNSLDTIPFKLLLKILKTDDFTLLSTEKVFESELKELSEIWSEIKLAYEKLDPDNEFSKTLKLRCRIERLSNDYKAVNLAVKGLRFEYNEELINILKSYRYKLSDENYFNDLDTIERESEAILLQIKKIEKKLPKEREEGKEQNIDKIIIAYNNGVMTDTNKVTVMQFHATKELFEEKVKALEKNKQ